MPINKVLILATRNPGKVREFSQLLAPLGYEVITAQQAGYDEEPDETGTTFRANAEIKARAVFEGTGGRYAVLADDSGLEVDALGGAPGVYSARYAYAEAGPGCSDDDNNKKLARELAGFHNLADRRARYRIALCLLQPRPVATREDSGERPAGVAPVVHPLHPDAPLLHFFEGACEGLIGFEKRGGGGFGYDVLFIPTGAGGQPLDGRTFAEMTAEEKHPLSHRGQAVKALTTFLAG